jgi:DegV family protein with EDD domain
MSGIRVVTDSASDVSPDLAAALGITVVPLTIRFGDEELLDQRDLDATEFWRRCKASAVLPETAAPSPGQFQAAFSEALDTGAAGVLCLTISGKLSATYQSARAAADAVGGDRVEVIDTESVTMGQGLLAVAAAEDAATGVGLAALADRTRNRMGRSRVFGVVGTLEHLQKGGRIGGAQALLGSILAIKPVIQVKDGVVAEESKQRTRARSVDYLAAKVRSAGRLERLAVVDGAASDLALLTTQLGDLELEHDALRVDLGPVVGTHAGPGTMGVCFQLAAGSTAPDG